MPARIGTSLIRFRDLNGIDYSANAGQFAAGLNRNLPFVKRTDIAPQRNLAGPHIHRESPQIGSVGLGELSGNSVGKQIIGLPKRRGSRSHSAELQSILKGNIELTGPPALFL